MGRASGGNTTKHIQYEYHIISYHSNVTSDGGTKRWTAMLIPSLDSCKSHMHNMWLSKLGVMFHLLSKILFATPSSLIPDINYRFVSVNNGLVMFVSRLPVAVFVAGWMEAVLLEKPRTSWKHTNEAAVTRRPVSRGFNCCSSCHKPLLAFDIKYWLQLFCYTFTWSFVRSTALVNKLYFCVQFGCHSIVISKFRYKISTKK